MHEIALPPLAAFALPTLDGLGKIAVFLIMLSILVVLHEYGHFLMARRAGVRVNDFAVGFGPTLLKWTSPRSGTNYRLNLLPIGGYCAMQGEDGKTSEAEQQRQFREQHASGPVSTAYASGGSVSVLERPAVLDPSALFTPPIARAVLEAPAATDNFQSKSALARLSIVIAGPIANFILAYVILFVAAVTFGIQVSDKVVPQIAVLVPNSPAAHAGFKVGDTLVAIDGQKISQGNAIVDKIHASTGKLLHITISRGGALSTIDVTPHATKVGSKTFGTIGFQPLPVFQRASPIDAVKLSGIGFVSIVTSQIENYGQLFSHFRQNASQLHGAIGMGAEAGMVQDMGWGMYFMFAATISIALGILNLLPFPALDGGRAVFIIAEMLRGKPVEAEKEAIVHVTGFAFLMVLMVVIAFHDVFSLISGKGVL